MVGRDRAAVRSIEDMLRAGALPLADQLRLDRALRFEACHPRSASLRALAAQRVPRPPSTAVGASLLVALSDGRASLRLLERKAPGEDESVPLTGTAAEAMRSAERLAWLALPSVARLAPPRTGSPWRATLIVKEGEGSDGTLDGESFGLAMGLASASELVNCPVPATVAALATLGWRGETGPVDALGRKIDVLLRWAPGVDTVLVSPKQRAEAEAAMARAASIRVVPCRTLAEAVAEVLPPADEALERQCREASTAARLADDLYRLALRGKPALLGWSCVEATADWLSEHLSGEHAERARIAAAIAARHAGRHRPLELRGSWGRSLRRPLRLRLLAHAVQHAADACEPGWERLVADALEHLPVPAEEDEHDLRLLGAAGRAYAAWCRYGDAAPLLERAVEGWLAIDEPAEASHPLCELLRIRGVERARDAVATLAVTAQHVAAVCDEVSRTFIRLALGRAWLQSGDPRTARAVLEDPGTDWDHAPGHVTATRLRWLGAAYRALGSHLEAAERLEQLARLAEHEPGETAFALKLARLDAALATGADPRPHLAALETSDEGREVRRLLDLGPQQPPEERARFVARHYRY